MTNFNLNADSGLRFLKIGEYTEKYVQHYFLPGDEADFYEFSTSFRANIAMVDVVDLLNKLIPSGPITFLTSMVITTSSSSVLIIASDHDKFDEFDGPMSKKLRRIHVNILGTRSAVEWVFNELHQIYPAKRDGTVIEWYYSSGGNLYSNEFDMRDNASFYDEFYPFLLTETYPTINSFCKAFDESTANVLILLGPPGTGKTSFIRQLLTYNEQSALTTYDDFVMQNDLFYIQALQNDKKYVIMEDADTLLLDRDKDGNKVMSKMLNASDGLISTINKKFIFTANILNSSRIDDALVRPGRCFACVNFRTLNRVEAAAAAGKLGRDLPHDGDEFALAEIFNGKKMQKERLGFWR